MFPLNKDALDGVSLKELRNLCRNHKSDIKGCDSKKIVFSTKEQCSIALNTGVWPDAPDVFDKAKQDKPTTQATTAKPSEPKGKTMELSIDQNNALAPLAKALAEMIDIKADVSDDRIIGLIKKHSNVLRIEVKKPDIKSPKKLGVQHKLFPRLLELCQLRFNVFLSGPPGSGKTTAADKVAEALELDFYPVSVCQQTTESRLVGFMRPDGTAAETDILRAYRDGGVLLVDEVDAGNSNVTMCLNAILANGKASFPGGLVNRHEDFICIGGANTWGHGANVEHVGRNPLDGAFKDRWLNMAWGYDEKFEFELAHHEVEKKLGSEVAQNKREDIIDWVRFIHQVRKAKNKLGIKIFASPRACMFGAVLIAKGLKESEVADLTLWNSAGKEAKNKIKKALEA